VREVWVINAQTLAVHVHRRPGLEGCQDKREVAPHEALVREFAASLAVMLGTLELI
jgi:Uma2 family endonuclease